MMAIGFVMQFAGMQAGDYDQVMQILGLATPNSPEAADKWPGGIISHTAGGTAQGWCVVDVWESQERFDAFMQSRLGPAMGQAGLPEPEVTPFEVYNRHD
jgi:hypothetical protein